MRRRRRAAAADPLSARAGAIFVTCSRHVVHRLSEMTQVPSMQVQVRVQVLRLQVQVQVHRPTISDANEIKQDS